MGRGPLPAGDRRQPRAAARRWPPALAARTLWETHREAAIESQRLAEQVDAALRRAGIDTWLLDGTQALALLWERLHPAAELTEPDEPARAARRRVPDRDGDHARATPPSCATGSLEAICGDPAAELDIGEHPAWLRHADGTLEETIHLATPPLATDPSWLAHLLSCPLPATLAVHIAVGVALAGEARASAAAGSGCAPRSATRTAATGSSAPMRRTRWRRPRWSTPSWPAQVGATVYQVGIYCSIRDPAGDAESVRADRQADLL